ncbi:hypothetical protein MUCCIDRAFT_85180 [Mucor lusitanicus CBS 277.49]|uniref:Uncharacterized protein n=1 Tax=Mucor lusitanicus CBS 277.49 TaxID=747725 RepID=A0A162YU70_MUCCL|nr:hypothetical protein MUCCIDRAFT_85180 [Mucor lusitanicus CBS 277.49]
MVNNLCLWSAKRDESEATFYRRFASILDTLLADTGVILADGETSLSTGLLDKIHKEGVIPTAIESLGTVKDTLRGLVTLKNHLVNIAWEVKSELHKIEHASVLEGICPTPSTGSSHSKSPFIFFTPKNSRVQKRKLLELDDDDKTTVNSFTDRVQARA